jgi:serine protease
VKRGLALVLLSAVLPLSGSVCFTVEDPPPISVDPTGSIRGTITVAAVGTDPAPFSLGIGGLRPDVPGVVPVDAGAGSVVVGPGHDVDADEGPIARARRAAGDFKPGEALVLFERGTYDDKSILPVLEDMKHEAGFGDVTITLKNCMVRRICWFSVVDADGFLDHTRTIAFVKAMKKARAPGITTVFENVLHRGFVAPNDPFYAVQWNMEAMRLPAAWDLTTGSEDIVVGVIDSGVKHANTDLRDRLTRDPNNFNRFVEFDFVSDGSLELDDVAGIDLDAEDPGDNLRGSDPGEDSYHGTHTAGIIGAETNNAFGVGGVTWINPILPVRVLGSQLSGGVGDIFNGILWAIGNTDPQFRANVTDVVNQRPARAINLSLGAPDDQNGDITLGWIATFDEIIDDPNNFIPNDAVFVVAAGNASTDAKNTTPANVPRVITVGASRFDGVRADYSNFGQAIDVLAPGGQVNQDLNDDGNDDGILSTWDTDVKSEQGTSMAAPHVTGLAALILSARPDLKHDDIARIVKDSANRTFRCNEGCGNGLVDAAQAMILAGAQLQPAPRISVDQSRVFFPGGIARSRFTVLNLGNVRASFTLALSGEDAALFTADQTGGSLGAGESLTVNLGLNRDGATQGEATFTVTGTGEAAGQETAVTLLFEDGAVLNRREVDAVLVQAMVRTDAGLSVVKQAVAERSTGFAYAIEGLQAGAYEVYAIGDDNHDGRFDTQFESQGAYPSRDTVTAVDVAEDDSVVEGINFFITLSSTLALEGGVGATCSLDADCTGITFGPGAECLGFEDGYCSRRCDDDRLCGETGVCRTFTCLNDAGQEEFCDLCAQRCVADAQCRDGYLCLFGACEPAQFAP